jgi:hypothetical protein
VSSNSEPSPSLSWRSTTLVLTVGHGLGIIVVVAQVDFVVVGSTTHRRTYHPTTGKLFTRICTGTVLIVSWLQNIARSMVVPIAFPLATCEAGIDVFKEIRAYLSFLLTMTNSI